MTDPPVAAGGIRYGYVGVGEMGAAMAGHLVSTGALVTVFDVDEQAVAALVERGASGAASAADLAAQCEVVSICVPAAAHLEAVLAGPGGIAEAARADQTLLVHSTVSPDTMRSAHAEAARWGGVLHDACVAGGVASAVRGDLMILAGGLAAMAPEARALLDIYGSKVIDGGPVGAGAALKLAFNVMTYAQFTAAATAYEIAAGTGVEPEAVVEAWRHVGQLGRLTESFLFVLGLDGDQIEGDLRALLTTSAEIAEKDLGLAASLLAPTNPFRAAIEQLGPLMADVYRVSSHDRSSEGSP